MSKSQYSYNNNMEYPMSHLYFLVLHTCLSIAYHKKVLHTILIYTMSWKYAH